MIKSESRGLSSSLSSIIAWQHSCRSVFIFFLVAMFYRSDGCRFFFFCWLRKRCHNFSVFLSFQSMPHSIVLLSVTLFLQGDSRSGSIEDLSCSQTYKRNNKAMPYDVVTLFFTPAHLNTPSNFKSEWKWEPLLQCFSFEKT